MYPRQQALPLSSIGDPKSVFTRISSVIITTPRTLRCCSTFSVMTAGASLFLSPHAQGWIYIELEEVKGHISVADCSIHQTTTGTFTNQIHDTLSWDLKNFHFHICNGNNGNIGNNGNNGIMGIIRDQFVVYHEIIYSASLFNRLNGLGFASSFNLFN